jgi:hypothetical protein
VRSRARWSLSALHAVCMSVMTDLSRANSRCDMEGLVGASDGSASRCI